MDEYESSFFRLASDVPELAIWIELQEQEATRQAFKVAASQIDSSIDTALRRSEEIHTALEGLHLLLLTVTSGLAPRAARWRTSLELANAHWLESSLLDIQNEHDIGVITPPPRDGYINPDYRIVESGPDAQPSVEHWWELHPRRKGLQDFLASYFTSPISLGAPLLI